MGNLITVFILIWKNFKLQMRHPWVTAIEILIPIFLLFLLLLLRVTASVASRVIETAFDSYDVNSLLVEGNGSEGVNLYYTPQSIFLDEIMSEVSEHLNVTSTGFDSEKELIAAYRNSSVKVIAGVIFHPDLKEGVMSYGPVEFTIRPEIIPGVSWNLSYSLPPFPFTELSEGSKYGSFYMNFGFLPVQNAITKIFMEKIIPNFQKKFDDLFSIRMRQLPHPPYESDSFYKFPEYYTIIAICFGFFYPSVRIAKDIVRERRTKLKHTLMMMGVSNWGNWIAWFIKNFIFLLFCCLIMTIMLCIRFGERAVFNESDSSLILLWLLLYASSLIMFTFFITMFFDKENSAGAATCILFIITFLPYIHSEGFYHLVPQSAKLLLYIFPNTLFALSVRVMLRSELYGKGFHWHTFHHSKEFNVELSMHEVFLAFVVNIVIFFVLTWYTEVMRPGPHGKKFPWYFPIMASYWTGSKSIPPSLSYSYRFINPRFFESDPPRVKPMMNIKNLTKVYDKNSKPVIDRIDLKAFKGQITTLLGHSCSGKTTFASMLYGSLEPTSGTIILKGYNMCKANETSKIAPFLGICPDYDVTIDELNIEENLFFYYKVKGFDSSGMVQEISHILGIFDLEIQKRKLASKLSESAKRRLSIGIALIGDSEIVILDEPTSNMSSFSRRIVWDALRLEKSARAIFLTTSYIKEANVLADKIAVIKDGVITCCGSPMFLKTKYVAGYQLIISKLPECNSVSVQKLVLSKIPDAVVISDTENELKMILPHDCSNQYPVVFKDLEEKDMKIKDFHISETTLDELYERIQHNAFSRTCKNKDPDPMKSVEEDSSFQHLDKERNEGFTLFRQHVTALLRRRYIFSSRKTVLTASQILILPLVVICSYFIKKDALMSIESIEGFYLFDIKKFGRTNVAYGIDPSSNFTIDLGDTYATILSRTEDMELVDLDEENYLNYLITKGTIDIKLYKTKYIIGALFSNDFNLTLITAFYNSDAYHSAPISLLYVHNAILAYYTKEESFYFRVKNEPLPYKDLRHQLFSTQYDLTIAFLWAVNFIIGMAILMSSFVTLLVREKSSKSKMQQIISGLNAFTYWFSSFIYDYCVYLIPCILVLVILSILQTECFSETDELGSLALLLFLHGFSALLFIYCCIFCYQSSSTAYAGIFLHYFLGIFLLLVVYRLEELKINNVSEPLNILFIVLMPSYCVVRGTYNIYRNCISNFICNNAITEERCSQNNSALIPSDACCLDRCGDSCLYWSSSHLSLGMSGIGKELIVLVFQPLVYIVVLIVFEMEIFLSLKLYIREKKRMRLFHEPRFVVDPTVPDEAEKMLISPLTELVNNNYYLILKSASKFYPRFAISKLSFGVQRGECFGLVGIDKAGKTTILKMISGAIPLSAGSIYIDGFSIQKYPHMIQDKVGFSFGDFAFLEELTVKETLTLYACIRGIPEKKIKQFIESLTSILSLNCGLMIKKCNITVRKKLSVAISIIGTPPLILLDEPSSGMDPVASRSTRAAVRQALNVGCTVLFTAKRMAECIALCNRVGLLGGGRLSYIGDIDHLKYQYKEGFTLILRIRRTRKRRSRHTRQAITLKGNLEEIKGRIEETIPNAVLKIEYSSYLNYYIYERLLEWSKIIELLEKMKFQAMIDSYTVCRTNLNEIFSYHVSYTEHSQDKHIFEYLKERKLTRI